jgi:RHS repeat-associated protein
MIKHWYNAAPLRSGCQTISKRYGCTLRVEKNNVLNYLLADHLGSSSLTTDANGALTATILYGAWGGTRYHAGTLNTKYEYTGQRNEAGIGLHFYGARWYDDTLGYFAQANSIIPGAGNSSAWDRYPIP